MTQPTLETTISLTGGEWSNMSYQHESTDTTNTYYEYKISGAPTDTQYFIAYNWTTKKWYDTNPNTTHSTFGTSANDTTSTSRETGVNPSIVYVMGDSSTVLKAQFDNPYYVATGSGGGTSTEGVATVEWQGSFTKNPGNDYWRWNVTGYNTEATDYISLYDYLPTLSSTEPPIGIRTFAASSSPTSQYGLFTPDLTKTYYIINYLSGGSSTNLNQQVLAIKNFANKKVFCNFW